jgi:hypothetical protein
MNLTGKKLAISNIKSETVNSKMYATAMKSSNALSVGDFDKSSGIFYSAYIERKA